MSNNHLVGLGNTHKKSKNRFFVALTVLCLSKQNDFVNKVYKYFNVVIISNDFEV